MTVTGLSLSPRMKELLGVLDDDWMVVTTRSFEKRTARALKNRGLILTKECLDESYKPMAHQYQAKLTAAGSAFREKLIQAA